MLWKDMASGLAGYLLIGIVLAFAMDYVAPPFGTGQTGLSVWGAPAAASDPDPAVVVDQSRKSDRFVSGRIEAGNTVPAEIPARRVGARNI